jgi:hypothetical protein
MLRDMGHPTVTGARIRPATVTGARIPGAAGTTAGFAGRHTVTRVTLITTRISGMAVLPGTDTHNGDRQRLTALPPW